MTTQTVQVHTFDYGTSLSSATLRSIADDTIVATADSVNEVTADSGLYAAVFVEAAVIAAGDYRLRAVVAGQPINRYVTLAGTDAEVVQSRSERHAVLNSTAQGQIDAMTRGLIAGVVGSSSSTTVVNVTSTESGLAVTDQLKGRVIIFNKDTTTAALRGQGAPIDTNDTTSITVASGDAFTTAPASGDTFTIY